MGNVFIQMPTFTRTWKLASTETIQCDVIKPSILLTGDNLTIDQVSALIHNQEVKVVFDERVKSTVTQSRTFLDKHLESKVIYGVNTGFGPMASHLIGKENLIELQYNLIQSHAVGMGQPVPHSFVLRSYACATEHTGQGTVWCIVCTA